MQEIDKSDVGVSVIPNVLEKCMAFIIYNNLVFIYTMQFMNSSLDALVKNLTNNFTIRKKKDCIHMNTWTVLKSFLMRNYATGVNNLVL